jgi:exosortase A-associated hydrolase 1
MNPLAHEEPLIVQSHHTPLLGVLHRPSGAGNASGMGVVIVNGGAQYRAGAHRMFVQLGRHLAAQGHAVLRFDFPGQGDSPGQPVIFEATAPYIADAINALHQHLPALQQTVLLGLCDGASASLLYLQSTPDTRIHALILLNPWVHNEAVQAQAQVRHYYRQRVLMPDFWLKLIKGGIGISALRELAQKLRHLRQSNQPEMAADFQTRMAQAWHAFGGRLLLVLSESDLTAQEFQSLNRSSGPWALWNQHPSLEQLVLPLADHTVSSEPAQAALFGRITAFLAKSPASTVDV